MMESSRKLLVGYDLCEDFTQISCYSYKTMEPVPIGLHEGDENCMIPTVLCLKGDSRQWLVGDEAISCAAEGSGAFVEHLLDKVTWGEEIQLYGQSFSAVSLIEKYLRKTLMLVKSYFPTEQITQLVVTIRRTEPVLVDRIYEALSLLGIEKDRAVVMSHSGVYLYYALSQDKSLWMNDVGLFEFHKDGLFFYQLRLNRRANPMIAGLVKNEFSEILNLNVFKQKGSNPAYLFENIANNALYKQIITTLYLTGSGFEGDWAQEVIKNLCIGRRVFLGQNLFTKGACYAAKELAGDGNLNDFILLNDDMISNQISVRVYCDSSFKDVILAQPGENWYDINKMIDVISENDAQLEVTSRDIMTRESVRQIIRFDKFIERPNRMTRFQVGLTCKDRITGLITITDLGFGDIYPSTGQTQEYIINL